MRIHRHRLVPLPAGSRASAPGLRALQLALSVSNASSVALALGSNGLTYPYRVSTSVKAERWAAESCVEAQTAHNCRHLVRNFPRVKEKVAGDGVHGNRVHDDARAARTSGMRSGAHTRAAATRGRQRAPVAMLT